MDYTGYVAQPPRHVTIHRPVLYNNSMLAAFMRANLVLIVDCPPRGVVCS